MDMNLQKYLSFVKTVEYGSFTKAAEILHYSQSGVSRMIGDLEKDWNMVLLERGKGGVRLTSNGLHMLPYAKELVADYEKMQMQVNALNGMQSGLIRIGTFSSIATHWLPNIIREFQKDYPSCCWAVIPNWKSGSQRAGWTAALCVCPPWESSIPFFWKRIALWRCCRKIILWQDWKSSRWQPFVMRRL